MNQVQISEMGQNFMKIRGLVKIGHIVEKICHVDEKFSSKNFFIFVKKMSSKLAKIRVTKMSRSGPRVPRETHIFFNIFTKFQVEKPRKKPRNSRETRIFLKVHAWGIRPLFHEISTGRPKFPGKLRILPRKTRETRIFLHFPGRCRPQFPGIS